MVIHIVLILLATKNVVHGISGSSVCDPNYVDDTNGLVCQLDEPISVSFTFHGEKDRENSAFNSDGICDIYSNTYRKVPMKLYFPLYSIQVGYSGPLKVTLKTKKQIHQC